MSVNENGNPRPDGYSVSVPFGPIGIGGTYYRNPGSPSAPSLTLTGSLGRGGAGLRPVFLRKGVTSTDTLGYGANAHVGFIPSVGVNVSIPDESGIPQPWNAKVSSVEAGVGMPGFAGTYTATPQQIADFLAKYIFPSAMGPQDELSSFARSLQSGVGTVGASDAPPIRFLGSRYQNPLGDQMAGWKSSMEGIDPRWPTVPMPPQQPGPAPGGLLGRLQEHLRSYDNY